jgi:hypothetical protein
MFVEKFQGNEIFNQNKLQTNKKCVTLHTQTAGFY